jgi:hypothetical protein
MLTVWVNQWKEIKGVSLFLAEVPRIPGRVELYNCGISYYQLRTTKEWKQAVGVNHRDPDYGGEGRAEYFGWVPLEQVMQVLMRSWFSVNLQGITAAPPQKSLLGDFVYNPRSVYALGSFNNTETEALYWGAVPVVHEQVLRSEIPRDLFLTVKRASEIPPLLRSKDAQSFARSTARRAAARRWVMDYHNPQKVYARVKELLFG